jgi:2-amino-4-hydroxy-6-hydroxymethyldihydropteridine diphosphokinase
MHSVFLALGSNLGNRIENLQSAVENIIEQIGAIQSIAPLYETEPWGFNSDNWFVNTVIEIETVLKPMGLLNKCMHIETELGRKRNKTDLGYSSRLIDIDILFYDKRIIDLPELVIPHKHLQDRKFVLMPLNDIAPDFMHPLTKQPVNVLLENCIDKMELVKIEHRLDI